MPTVHLRRLDFRLVSVYQEQTLFAFQVPLKVQPAFQLSLVLICHENTT